ncbi:MAG: MATE family efflux transporter [Bacteroidales bacterium]
MAPSYHTIWKISFPIFLSLLAQNIIIVVDTAFLGRVGETELGASAIGGLFYVCLFIIGFGFATGCQILIGRRNGEGNYHMIGRYVDHNIYFLVSLGVLLVILTKIFSGGILRSILTSPEIWKASNDFMQIRIWGLGFAFMNMVFKSFYIGITRTPFLILSATIMALVNILFDYLFIFGNMGFPAMGIEGAAFASVIAEGSSLFFFILITLSRKDLRKYNLFRLKRLDFQIIMKIFDVAGFIMLQYFFSIASWFSFFLIIEQTGERPLAVSNIIRSLYMIMSIPIFGLGSATSTIVSNTIGKGEVQKVIPAVIRITKISFFSIAAVIALAYVFSDEILSFYTNDPSLVVASKATFHVTLLVLTIFSVAIILFNGVSGTANTGKSFLIEIIALIFYLVAAYFFAIRLQLPVHLVWFSELIYFGLMALLSIAYLKWGNWMKKMV